MEHHRNCGSHSASTTLLFPSPTILILDRHFWWLFFKKFLILEVREGRTEGLFYKTAAHSSFFRVDTLLWEDWQRFCWNSTKSHFYLTQVWVFQRRRWGRIGSRAYGGCKAIWVGKWLRDGRMWGAERSTETDVRLLVQLYSLTGKNNSWNLRCFKCACLRKLKFGVLRFWFWVLKISELIVNCYTPEVLNFGWFQVKDVHIIPRDGCNC